MLELRIIGLNYNVSEKAKKRIMGRAPLLTGLFRHFVTVYSMALEMVRPINWAYASVYLEDKQSLCYR